VNLSVSYVKVKPSLYHPSPLILLPPISCSRVPVRVFSWGTNKAAFPRDRYTESAMFPFICLIGNRLLDFLGYTTHTVRTLVSNKRYTSIDPTIYSNNQVCPALGAPVMELKKYCVSILYSYVARKGRHS
jgi:hypothetical protein